jgi:hypothetical protein
MIGDTQETKKHAWKTVIAGAVVMWEADGVWAFHISTAFFLRQCWLG